MKKFLMIICIVSILFSQGAVAFADVYETEPNDTMDTADKIEITDYNSIIVNGIVSPVDLVDWYKIVPSVTGVSYFALPLYGGRKGFTFSLYDSSGNFITKGKNLGNIEMITDIYLRKGSSYYIKVEYELDEYPTQPYVVSLQIRQAKKVHTNNE